MGGQAEKILDKIWIPIDIKGQNEAYQKFVKDDAVNTLDYLYLGELWIAHVVVVAKR